MPLRGFAVYEASNADEVIALLELHEEKKSEPCSPGIHLPGSVDGLKLTCAVSLHTLRHSRRDVRAFARKQAGMALKHRKGR